MVRVFLAGTYIGAIEGPVPNSTGVGVLALFAASACFLFCLPREGVDPLGSTV